MKYSNKTLVAICSLLITLVCVGVYRSQEVTAQEAHAKVSNEQPYVTAKMLADTTAIQAGKPFKVGVELTMKSGWHTYYKESGDAGLPTKITWKLPSGFTAGPILWQKPSKFNDSGIVTYGYKDKTLIGATITPPANFSGDNVDFKADVKWLSCAEICVPGGTSVSLSLPVDKTGSTAAAANAEEFSKLGFEGSVKDLTLDDNSKVSSAVPAKDGATNPRAPDQPTDGAANPQSTNVVTTSRSTSGVSVLNQKFNVEGSAEKPQSLLAYLALAFVGGMILNVMPCVLPVIAIKVLSFFEQARDEPARVRLMGLTFTAGIISSFMVLAGVVIALQATGRSVGWGFQFQYPGFLIAMSALVLLFAMSLFGLFYVSVPGGSKVDELANKEGYSGTFFKGVLATILSTPCTAPFLGTALGFAFAQPWWTVALIFFTIGLGMSLPYLLLTAKPEWMKFMPKPGVWMEKFKESLGFVLLATVAWLLGVLGSELGIEGIIGTTYFLIALAFAAWIVGRFTDLTTEQGRKITIYAISIAIVATAFYFFVYPLPGISLKAQPLEKANVDAPIKWQPFSVEALDKELSAHKTVLLDFTADWCLTCKFNEKTVLNSAPVVEKIKALNVVPMQADWTVQDPKITELLNKFNRSGVPLYVIFPADKPNNPIVLPEVINQQMVLDKLDQAGKSSL
ncbi:MAG: thioredoxin family protein [Cyanobacteria bacterium SZAS-4]|nr:thioredoxin family protein [Cyanobacteria bacterium SZAS-4]